jgi:uracil-DNA glycosylase family 4
MKAASRTPRSGSALTSRAKSPAPAVASRWNSLAAVTRAVIACERCPRLRAHCEQVAREKRRAYLDETYWGRPVPGFGDAKARLVIVGLAPGAHGSNRTGRMFTGDASGNWLYAALHREGFASQPESVSRDDGQRLRDCWITAAGRCAPPGNKPTPAELDRCRPFLVAELALLKPRVVLALGRIGHEAWLRASGWWERLPARERPRFAHASEARLPDGVTLLASFHPSRQNTQTGKLTLPMWRAVFARARRLVDGA